MLHKVLTVLPANYFYCLHGLHNFMEQVAIGKELSEASSQQPGEN